MRGQTIAQLALLALLAHFAESETRHAISMRPYWRMYLACLLSFVGFWGLWIMGFHYFSGGLGTHASNVVYQYIGISFFIALLCSGGLINWRRKQLKQNLAQHSKTPVVSPSPKQAAPNKERVVNNRHPLD